MQLLDLTLPEIIGAGYSLSGGELPLGHKLATKRAEARRASRLVATGANRWKNGRSF